jgi:hypothetical protein
MNVRQTASCGRASLGSTAPLRLVAPYGSLLFFKYNPVRFVNDNDIAALIQPAESFTAFSQEQC